MRDRGLPSQRFSWIDLGSEKGVTEDSQDARSKQLAGPRRSGASG